MDKEEVPTAVARICYVKLDADSPVAEIFNIDCLLRILLFEVKKLFKIDVNIPIDFCETDADGKVGKMLNLHDPNKSAKSGGDYLTPGAYYFVQSLPDEKLRKPDPDEQLAAATPVAEVKPKPARK